MYECVEYVVSPEEYQRARDRVFQIYSFFKPDFDVGQKRGLREKLTTSGKHLIDGYEELVRDINRDSLIAKIDEKIAKDTPVDLLDVCCGRASYLRDCLSVARWKGFVRCHGIDARDFGLEAEEVPGLEIKAGDAQGLEDYYQQSFFDIITAMYAYQYLADPLWALQETHNLLKVGGDAYIYLCPVPIQNIRRRKWFLDYLKERGIRCNDPLSSPLSYVSFAIHRESVEPIRFPLAYEGWTYEGGEMRERFLYRVTAPNDQFTSYSSEAKSSSVSSGGAVH